MRRAKRGADGVVSSGERSGRTSFEASPYRARAVALPLLCEEANIAFAC